MTSPIHSTRAESTPRLHDLALRHLRPPRPLALRYAWSVAVWLATLVLTLELAPYIQRANFVFFWLAVLFAAWYAGFVPALLAAGAAVLAVNHYLLPPVDRFRPIRTEDLLTLGIFGVAALLVSALAGKLARAHRQAEADARELAALARELEDQAVELEQQTEEAQALAEELEQANEDLQEQTAEAEAANAAKSAFLATTSHELRTPLNAIVGYAELLEMGLGGPLTEQQRAYVGRVRQSARHLLALINDVLDLAKVEAEQLPVGREPGSLSAAVEGALALVHPQAASRGLTVTNACGPGGDAAYVGDPARVEQVLVNLLSNAVRFTDPPGAITLTCGVTDRPAPEARLDGPGPWAYVRVEDTGIGISPEKLGEIWEPFVQAEAGLTRTRGGTGLGLAISRKLARLMGGDLTARSRLGSGSAFFLWLPAASAAESALVATSAPERRGDARNAEGLAVAGDAALTEVERILDAYVARLRTDPAIASARVLTDAELEDHAATLLADIAQCLSIIEHARGAPTDLMRDATLIQRVVAAQHGRQRDRLGWSAAEVRREFEILREEVARAVRRRTARGPDARVDRALALFGHFLEHAEQVSVRSLQGQDTEDVLPTR